MFHLQLLRKQHVDMIILSFLCDVTCMCRVYICVMSVVCVVYRPYSLYKPKCILALSFVNPVQWLFWVPVPLTHLV